MFLKSTVDISALAWNRYINGPWGIRIPLDDFNRLVPSRPLGVLLLQDASRVPPGWGSERDGVGVAGENNLLITGYHLPRPDINP